MSISQTFTIKNNPMKNQGQFVEVYAGEFLRASAIQNILENEGIQSYIFNENMGTIAAFEVQAGGISPVLLKVGSLDCVAARKIVDDFMTIEK
jgi:Putative prokaryotic signal transducing protein